MGRKTGEKGEESAGMTQSAVLILALACASGCFCPGATGFVVPRGPMGLVMTNKHPRGPIAVVGASGRLGRAAVQQLAAQGVPTRVLCRHEISDASRTSASADGTASSAEVMAFLSTLPAVTLVQGDVTDPASLGVLMEGCTACLALYGAVRTFKASDLLPFVDQSLERTHARQVNYEGVRNILAAARASKGCKRVVRITGKGEAPWSFFTILIDGVGSFTKAWKYAGETVPSLRSAFALFSIQMRRAPRSRP